jgi:hypothetical protein
MHKARNPIQRVMADGALGALAVMSCTKATSCG